MDLVEVKATDKSGEQTYKGVLISALLEQAGAAYVAQFDDHAGARIGWFAVEVRGVLAG